MNQRGFATLEVILMVVVIGILASIAVPRFTDVTTRANTAKVQADLSTLDSASQVYYMDNGAYPTIAQLVSGNYINAEPTAPEGSIYLGSSTATPITSAAYGIETSGDNAGRAYITVNSAQKYIGDIGKK